MSIARFFMASLAALALALLHAPAPALSQPQDRRMALVVGNGAYTHLEALPNATRDARAIARALETQGFEVTLLLDSTHAGFADTLGQFAHAAAGADAALFYFSGHGFQKSGVNYLAPVDAVLDTPAMVPAQTLRLDDVTDRISAQGRRSIILLDACRNNPLPAALRDDTPMGLAVPETGRDTFVAFATQPGNLTYDGREGDNSPFTSALLRHLGTEGQPISQMMIEVRNEVEAATLGQQIPWDQSSLTAPFFFNPLQPTAEDLAALATMSAVMQDRFLRTWRAQGAQIPDEVISAAIGADSGVTQAAAVMLPPESPLADATELPDFAASLIFIDDVDGTGASNGQAQTAETARPDAAGSGSITLAALAPLPGAGSDIGTARAVPMQQLSASDILATGQSPFIPDAPIEWLAALDPARIPDLRRPDQPDGRQRIIGIDVTPPGMDLPEMTAQELATELQTALQQVGCYRMQIDGQWGPGSRGALRNYLTHSGQSTSGEEPTPEILIMVRASTGAICPAPVAQAPSQRARTTTTRAPAPASPPVQQQAAPATPAAPSGSRMQNALRSFR
ncbi:caspase family protein [Roseinatronobacter alkalisoli]|uniref:Caspase family protein n=1 Tax=Roseinatronobacter alkalisoli TaxID=3028235 RepID=A0ABT5TDU4_9RHOB|nr:caspase family protein [Roseinatronobacter sp. HJB301]MDD7972875.1 caspase family protein [Roseinatronobacter sp. HJB301]